MLNTHHVLDLATDELIDEAWRIGKGLDPNDPDQYSIYIGHNWGHPKGQPDPPEYCE